MDMTWDVALILGVDGLANGAIYLLAGLGLVLIFSVTRVIFVPFGDIAAFAALSLAAFEAGKLPPTIGMVAVFAALALLVEIGSLLRKGEARHPAVQATMAIIAQVSDTLPREGARVAGVSQRGEASGPR